MADHSGSILNLSIDHDAGQAFWLAAGEKTPWWVAGPQFLERKGELDWATRSTRGQESRLGLLVLLKVFQQLHHFPDLDTIPASVTELVRISAGLNPGTRFGYDRKVSPTLFRHYRAVREFLGIQAYLGTEANEGDSHSCKPYPVGHCAVIVNG